MVHGCCWSVTRVGLAGRETTGAEEQPSGGPGGDLCLSARLGFLRGAEQHETPIERLDTEKMRGVKGESKFALSVYLYLYLFCSNDWIASFLVAEEETRGCETSVCVCGIHSSLSISTYLYVYMYIPG